jgi:hypothetical protein
MMIEALVCESGGAIDGHQNRLTSGSALVARRPLV